MAADEGVMASILSPLGAENPDDRGRENEVLLFGHRGPQLVNQWHRGAFGRDEGPEAVSDGRAIDHHGESSAGASTTSRTPS